MKCFPSCKVGHINNPFRTYIIARSFVNLMNENRNWQSGPSGGPGGSNHNENSSNSPYYNQPTYDPFRKEIFAALALLFGSLSLLASCTGVFSVIFGSLGILFSALAFRSRKKKSSLAVMGVIMSCVGIITGVLYIVVAVPMAMKDPLYQQQMNYITEQLTGESFTEFMENTYGIQIE